jgi:DNA invertase Pin-like site-specific DNA recombinase
LPGGPKSANICVISAVIWGIPVKSLADTWADTTTAHGELMITILGGLATFERHLILSRTSEGIKRARAAGVRFGRKPALDAAQRAHALKLLAEGKTQKEVAQLLGCDQATISRLVTRAARLDVAA